MQTHKLKITLKDLQYEVDGKEVADEAELKRILDVILAETYRQTMEDGHAWIDKYVPKRTGQLRDNLHRHLDSSRYFANKYLIKIRIGTNIDYATYVNDMTTRQVRHHGEIGTAYYYGYYGQIILDDPNAVGHFFDQLVDYLKKRLQLHYNDNLKRYAKVV